MEPYLSKALRRAGTKLIAGLAFVGALVGVRIVTATPDGFESDLEQLERLETERWAETSEESGAGQGGDRPSSARTGAGEPAAFEMGSSPVGSDSDDLDRLVRCHGEGGMQYMRAADCATRGGNLEDLPPPKPESAEVPAER